MNCPEELIFSYPSSPTNFLFCINRNCTRWKSRNKQMNKWENGVDRDAVGLSFFSKLPVSSLIFFYNLVNTTCNDILTFDKIYEL